MSDFSNAVQQAVYAKLLSEFSFQYPLPYTNEFETWTIGNGVTISNAAAQAYDGSQTADIMTRKTSGSNTTINKVVPTVPGTVYLFSYYVNINDIGTASVPNSVPQITLYLFNAPQINQQVIGIVNGSVIFGDESIPPVNLGNGWYRVWIPFTANNTSITVNIELIAAATKSVFLWRASMVEGTQFDPALPQAIPVFDSTPFQPDGDPAVNFPCIVIGDDTIAPWDTDETVGVSATVTIHVWSRYLGKKEVKTILGQINAALNRQAAGLTATGYRFVDCLFEFSEVIEEIDGKTRHGVCRYRITMEKL